MGIFLMQHIRRAVYAILDTGAGLVTLLPVYEQGGGGSDGAIHGLISILWMVGAYDCCLISLPLRPLVLSCERASLKKSPKTRLDFSGSQADTGLQSFPSLAGTRLAWLLLILFAATMMMKMRTRRDAAG